MRSTSIYLEVALAAFLLSISARAMARERESQAALVRIRTGQAACTVELDTVVAGKTNAQGEFELKDVEPTDHYIHVLCPGQHEVAYFVSPRAGETVEVPATATAGSAPGAGNPSPDAPLEAAKSKIQLRQLVLKAVELRASGEFDEAVAKLHEAAAMDPENSDLHRELGITFLLAKDWKRARVEMLEAIKHDPSDADAHNGLGYALEKLGELEPALQEYRTATRLEPDDPSYRQHYVDALARVAAQKSEKKK